MNTKRTPRPAYDTPALIYFEGDRPLTRRRWRLIGYQKPMQGQYYLSGCKGYVRAWRAPNDLLCECFVVEALD